MSIVFFLLWLIITVGLSGQTLHSIGEAYGAHVSAKRSTQLVVFIAIGTVVWLMISFLRWAF